MTVEPNPQHQAGVHQDDSGGRDRSLGKHVDVIASAPAGGNSALRWMVVVVPALLIVLGGAYLVNMLMTSMQQAPAARRAVQPPPAPAKDARNPTQHETAQRRAPGDAGGDSFDIEAVLKRLAAADVNAGETAFKLCLPCHAAERNAPHKVGPNLWNIVGARKAALADFRYSQALSREGGRWSYSELARYLHDTRNAVPGTSMAFFGIKDDRRMADLLAYMRTRADRPVPLPK
jgi:cytochrome c